MNHFLFSSKQFQQCSLSLGCQPPCLHLFRPIGCLFLIYISSVFSRSSVTCFSTLWFMLLNADVRHYMEVQKATDRCCYLYVIYLTGVLSSLSAVAHFTVHCYTICSNVKKQSVFGELDVKQSQIEEEHEMQLFTLPPNIPIAEGKSISIVFMWYVILVSLDFLFYYG